MRKSTISNFDHLLKYKSPIKAKTFRSTQIVSTINVESSEEKLQQLIAAGMNIACFDCSQEATLDEFQKSIGCLRSALKNYNGQRKSGRKSGDSGDFSEKCFDVSVAIALNIKAPTLMTGALRVSEECYLQFGQSINITNNTDYIEQCDADLIYINYPKLTELDQHQVIFIDDRIKLAVESVNVSEAIVCCRILKGGFLTNHYMDVLIPSVKLNFPPVDKKFIDFLEFAKRNHVDMIFASINDQFAFETIKCHLKSEGQENNIALVAKIETQAGYDNLEKFLEHADGILISRYKLGLNMSTEKAIAAQKCMIAKCLKAGIPSIVSSNMLKKMSESIDEPSSAEISDIFNATIDGCDCVMLESDSVRCVQKMQDTILESEQMINHRRWFRDLLTQVPIPSDISNSVAVSACIGALVANASAIIVYTTMYGDIVRLVAKYRPECPIVVVTSNESIARQCLLLRGVSSINVKDKSEVYRKNVESAIENGLHFIHQSCIIQKYPSTVVAVYAQKEGLISTNSMRVVNVPSKPEKQRVSFEHDFGSDNDDGSEIP